MENTKSRARVIRITPTWGNSDHLRNLDGQIRITRAKVVLAYFSHLLTQL